MKANEVYLKKRKKVILPLPNGDKKPNKRILATFLKNIESTGFTFSPEAIREIMKFSTPEIKKFQDDIIPVLNEMVGNHVNHRPMYPNFPKQVMEMEEAELYINAIIHYITTYLYRVSEENFPTWFPEYEEKYKKIERPEFPEDRNLTLIELGNKADFRSIFTELLSSNASISEYDKDVIRFFIENNYYNEKSIPEKIPQKEQLALLVGELYKNNKDIGILSKSIKTATDVLRVAVIMSDGDVSLSKNTRFKKFNRRDRRTLLNLLNNVTNNPLEDMYRHRMQWIRLGEIIHPGEYKERFTNAFINFQKLRNVNKIQSFAGKVNYLLDNGHLGDALNLLKTRPGEYVKRIDYLLRNFDPMKVSNNLDIETLSNVSTPVLLRAYGHFKNRNSENDVRVFFPKGNIAKAFVKENDLPYIGRIYTNEVLNNIEKALYSRFENLEGMGKVYIDDKLKNIKVPFSDRSAAESLTTIPRGSKFDMPKENTIRFFIHWRNLNVKDYKYYKGTVVDLDLSCIFYKDNWDISTHISYTILKNNSLNACHSGDITNGKGGASEFIDFDVNDAKRKGIRYIVPSVLSFTHQPFENIPDCFFGWMGREYPNSGEIYEPLSVKNKINLTGESKINVPMVIDLWEEKIFWADLDMSNAKMVNNVESNKGGLIDLAKATIYDEKPSIYDLLSFHIISRADEVVDDPEDADIVFTMDNIFDKLDEIKAEYLL